MKTLKLKPHGWAATLKIRNLKVRKGGLPPLVECHSTLAGALKVRKLRVGKGGLPPLRLSGFRAAGEAHLPNLQIDAA